MNLKSNESQVFVKIVVVTVFAFVGWVALLAVVWLVVRPYVGGGFWAMAEAMSAAVTAAAVVSAGYVAYRELSENANSRYIEVASRLFDELNSQENIVARRWIYQHLSGSAETEMDFLEAEGQAAMKRVLNSLDKVSFLTQSTWIPDEIIMPWMHPMIAKSWSKLEPYVRYERQRRNEPYYYMHAEQLAKRCADWRGKNIKQSTIEWIDGAL